MSIQIEKNITRYIENNPKVKQGLIVVANEMQQEASKYLQEHGTDTINPMIPEVLPLVELELDMDEDKLYSLGTSFNGEKILFGMGQVVKIISNPELWADLAGFDLDGYEGRAIVEYQTQVRDTLLAAIKDNNIDEVLKILKPATRMLLSGAGYGSHLISLAKLDQQWVEDHGEKLMQVLSGAENDNSGISSIGNLS